MIYHRSAAIAAATLVAATPLLSQTIPDDVEIVALQEWRYDDLYSNGVSAESLLDREVFDATGEEIGELEDMIIGQDGKVLSIVAEVGGFWDIGDTHVSVPIDQVDMSALDRIVVPVTEDSVDDYDVWSGGMLTAEEAETGVVGGVDDEEIPQAFRAAEMIGDFARLRNETGYLNYGYVSDLILRDGEVAAVVVQPRGAYGAGYRAYPYYGYGTTGPYAGSRYYDMPYTEEDVGPVEEFDYDRFDS